MPKRSWWDYVNERPENVSGSVTEKSGADMLAAWLAEDRVNNYISFLGWVSVVIQYRCILSRKHYGDGPTPDAAMRDAVGKARKS